MLWEEYAEGFDGGCFPGLHLHEAIKRWVPKVSKGRPESHLVALDGAKYHLFPKSNSA